MAWISWRVGSERSEDAMPNTLRVVVVDDNYDANAGLSKLLEMSGFQVAGRAYDGLAGLSVIKSTKPDVAILDIAMPALDGYRAALGQPGEPGRGDGRPRGNPDDDLRAGEVLDQEPVAAHGDPVQPGAVGWLGCFRRAQSRGRLESKELCQF